jgi:parvulin-like peptidyl-prolyl isomerase
VGVGAGRLLAKEFSDGPTGSRGGELGQLPKGRMPPNFQAKVGGVVGPVETHFGYHVIKRTK